MNLNKNNLTKSNFNLFKKNVFSAKHHNLQLHTLGNDISEIIKNIFENGLPIIPKIFFEISSIDNKKQISESSSNESEDSNNELVTSNSNTISDSATVNSGNNYKINLENSSLSDDIYGAKIINKYYEINHAMSNLSIVKKHIMSIIKSVKPELDLPKYRVSKRSYNIMKKYLLMKFQQTISETFKTQKEFIAFKDAFCDESFNLFKEFKEDIPLFQYIFNNTYTGLRDTKNFFNKLFKKYKKERNVLTCHIKDNFGLLAFSPLFDIEKVSETQHDESKNKSNSINYNKYLLYGNKKIQSASNFNNEEKISVPLNEKINAFNLMYISMLHSDYYTKIHMKKMEVINSELKETVDALLSGPDDTNLYDLILLTLNLDFSLLELMFYYCERTLFDTAMKSNENIKKYILGKLNTVDMYFDMYKDWLGSTDGNDKNSITKLLKYEEFFKTVMDGMPEGPNIELKGTSTLISIPKNEIRTISKSEPDKLYASKNTNTSENRVKRMIEKREFLKKFYNRNIKNAENAKKKSK